MKFSLAAAVAVLAAIVEARPQFTNTAFAVSAGTPFTLTWSNAVGAVKIVLNKETSPGSGVFNPAVTLASGLTGTTTTVTIDASTISSANYAFSIEDTSGDQPNYSAPFALTGTGSSTSLGTVSSTGSSTSAPSSTRTSSSTTSSSSAATTSSVSSTSTKTSATTTTSSTTSTTPTNNNGVGKIQSSLALVFVGLAAYAFLN